MQQRQKRRDVLWLNDTFYTAKVSEQVNRKFPLRTRFYSFQSLVSSTSLPLEPQTSVPSGEYIKKYCEPANRQKKFTSEINIVGILCCTAIYFRQFRILSAYSQQQLVFTSSPQT